MIRRWSCLITINNNFKKKTLFMRNHKVTIFKSSVSFKRFSFKITKLKRKSLIRIKHRTTWMLYTNVIKLWVRDFMFMKSFSRYQFFHKITINNFFFYNFNFIRNRNELFFYNFNFIFYTLSKKIHKYFLADSLKLLSNTNINFAWFGENAPILNNSVIPVYSEWDKSLYSYNSFKKNNFEIENIFNFFFDLTLLKIVELRKIFIFCHLRSIFNFKNVK